MIEVWAVSDHREMSLLRWCQLQDLNVKQRRCRIGKVWIKEPRANPFAKYAWSLRLLTDAEKGALR